MEKAAKLQRPWLTVKETAKKLALHPDTVERLIRSGELEAKKFGRSWRIPRHAVMPKETRHYSPQYETK